MFPPVGTVLEAHRLVFQKRVVRFQYPIHSAGSRDYNKNDSK